MKLDLAQSPHVVNDVIVPIISRITSEDMARDFVREFANLIFERSQAEGWVLFSVRGVRARSARISLVSLFRKSLNFREHSSQSIMNKLEHTGTGAFANSMLEVMRRCHVRFDVSASQFWIELPTTVQPGELNKDQFEHVENLRLVRIKGERTVL